MGSQPFICIASPHRFFIPVGDTGRRILQVKNFLIDDRMYTLDIYIMIRTQVYLTVSEKNSLETIAAKTGQSQSLLIREAIDRLIHRYEQEPASRLQNLRRARGSWAKLPKKDF